MGDVRLRFIVGPTAAGKSRLALALAQAVGATIVSADSRQIYRGFDVGTAKPSPNDMALVPHLGIDVVEPTERFSAERFATLARGAIHEGMLQGRDRKFLVVGGTGFYVRALVEPLFPEPDLDPTRREQFANYFASVDTEMLRRWCLTIDPERSRLGRTQLLRALEVALLTGRRLSELFRADSDRPRITPQYLVVDPGATLHEAIELRIDNMIGNGWLDEVRRLAASVPAKAPAWKATGYDTLRRYVEGGSGKGAGDSAADLSAARAEIVAATRQYAKRQRTWFRHQLQGDMLRIDPNDSSARDWALAWWHSGEPT